MADSPVTDTTQLLRAWVDGEEQALEALIPGVYRELRRLTGRCLQNEPPGQTLQVSDLVHKAYLHPADLSRRRWQHRNRFFAVSAALMRRTLVDRARRRMAAKRGDRVHGVNVAQGLGVASARSGETAALPGRLA